MCDECMGHFGIGCPVCGDGELKMKECPSCHGLGHGGYYAFDCRSRKLVSCTEETWLSLPENEDDAEDLGQQLCKCEVEICSECGGDGVVADMWY